MNPEILNQIEKELKYSQKKYPDQDLTREQTVKLTIQKMNETIIHHCSGCVQACTDVERFMCNSFASISILIRGIEREIKRHDEQIKSDEQKLEQKKLGLFANRNKLFGSLKL